MLQKLTDLLAGLQAALANPAERGRILRFGVNGVVATAVHYGVLYSLLNLLSFPYAGVGNGIASVFGITASFLGNAYFVFPSDTPLGQALRRFLLVYAMVALFHTLALTIWTDWWGLNVTLGFLGATAGSLVLTFLGNRFLVFEIRD